MRMSEKCCNTNNNINNSDNHLISRRTDGGKNTQEGNATSFAGLTILK